MKNLNKEIKKYNKNLQKKSFPFLSGNLDSIFPHFGKYTTIELSIKEQKLKICPFVHCKTNNQRKHLLFFFFFQQ